MSGAWSQITLYVLAGIVIFVQRRITREKNRRVEDDRWDLLFGWGVFWTVMIAFNGGPVMDSVWNQWQIDFHREYVIPYVPDADWQIEVERIDRGTLLWRQAKVFGGTLGLFAVIWGTIHYYGSRLTSFEGEDILEFMYTFLGRLALAFWLPVLGIGAIYGISANHSPLDVLRHPARLLNPVTLLAAEITILWVPIALARWSRRRNPSGRRDD
ncbi:MAG: hypothetical protein R3338_15350 [Thermoanaerobaculia bacterium]|nr:hypothetical protein [Thermoanaerobaculia bacterium]